MDPNLQPFQNQQMSSAGPPAKRSHNNSQILYVIIAIGAIVSVVLLVLLGITYSNYSTLQNNFDTELESSKTELLETQKAELLAEFQKEKDALVNTYESPVVLGKISFKYPRDWSLYLTETENSNTQIDAITHPGQVRSGSNASTTYALRLQLIDSQYATELAKYQSKVDKGTITARPVTVNNAQGVVLTGELDNNTTGSLAIIPFLDKSIVLTTETTNYTDIFNEALGSITFN